MMLAIRLLTKVDFATSSIPMKVDTNRQLLEFSPIRHDASGSLQALRKAMDSSNFSRFAELREAFRSVDKVGNLHVFNIAGNKNRLISFLHFDKQLCYIKQILTYAEYDKEAWKK
jgi:mRNA interferase HigB